MANQALAVLNSQEMEAEDIKPQGYLYAVIFETGAVKVGMSRRLPLLRIKSHRSAGKQFGVSVSETLVVSVYTLDVVERESLLVEALRQVAVCTAGREWFKFECKKTAAQFVSENMGGIEAESYAVRPSKEQLSIIAAESRASIDKMMNLIPNLPPVRQLKESRLFAIRQFLTSFDLPLNGAEEVSLIELFYRFDRLAADCERDAKKLPESAVGMDCYGIDYAMAFSREDEEQRGLAAIAIHNFISDTELQHSLAVAYGGRA